VAEQQRAVARARRLVRSVRKTHPSNAIAEGRANNRRVEIIVEREPHASSQ
jgi:flagellar motor protein MotB